MDTETIRQMIATLAAEEESLEEAAKKIDVRLVQLRSARAALAPLINEPVPGFEGNLADACRQILKTNSERSFSPKEMRLHLIAIGYDTKKHDHVMAAIHSVLKRLAESDSSDVDRKEAKDGSGTRYFWKKKSEAPVKPTLPITVDTAAAIAAMSGNYQNVLQQISDFNNDKGLAKIAEQMKNFAGNNPAIEKHMAAIADLANGPAAKHAAETIKQFEAAAGKELAKLKAAGLI